MFIDLHLLFISSVFFEASSALHTNVPIRVFYVCHYGGGLQGSSSQLE